MAEEMEVDGVLASLVERDTGLTETAAPQVEQTEQAKAKKRFEIKKWNAVAFWSWDMEVEQCAICRNHLMEPCIDCAPNSINQPNQECVTAWGTCNHGFHLHCIQRWTSTRNVCPLDNNPWSLARYGR